MGIKYSQMTRIEKPTADDLLALLDNESGATRSATIQNVVSSVIGDVDISSIGGSVTDAIKELSTKSKIISITTAEYLANKDAYDASPNFIELVDAKGSYDLQHSYVESNGLRIDRFGPLRILTLNNWDGGSISILALDKPLANSISAIGYRHSTGSIVNITISKDAESCTLVTKTMDTGAICVGVSGQLAYFVDSSFS